MERYLAVGIILILVLSIASINFIFSFQSITGFAVYNLCKQYYGEKVSLQEFERILTAVHYNNCGEEHASLNISFAMSENELKQVAGISGISTSKVIIRDLSEDVVPFGGGYLIVYGHKGDYPLDFNDNLEIFQEGKPNPDTIILVRAEQVLSGEDVLRFGGVFISGKDCQLFFSGPSKEIKFYTEMRCSDLKSFTVPKQDVVNISGSKNGDFRLIILSDLDEVGKIIPFKI